MLYVLAFYLCSVSGAFGACVYCWNEGGLSHPPRREALYACATLMFTPLLNTIVWLLCAGALIQLALLRIGIIRFRRDGTIRWPLSVAPWWMWKWTIRHPIKAARETSRAGWGVYVFRNLPGVIKWQKDRLLPRRWGFGIMGLIEFGDRG